jgi:endosialidase-like protein
MRHFAARVSVALVCLLSAAIVHAQPSQHSAAVPRVVRITGVLVPANGQPTGPVETVTLAIYADEKGGAPLWQETQTVTVDAEGRYAVLLGATETDGLPLDLFASGEARWLGRRFDRPGEHEQARVLLASVPYALKAGDADTLGGRPASAYVVAGSTSGTKVAASDGSVAGPATAGTANFIGKFVTAIDLGDSAIYEASGLVGVNTSTPFDAMHVRFTNTVGSMTGFAVQNLGNTASSYSGMLFYDQTGALGQFQGFNNSTHEYRINNIASNGTINFMTGSISRFKVANNGFIGIGTATPGVPLDIVGNAFVTTSGSGAYFTTGNTALTLGTSLGWFTSLRTTSGIIAGDGVLSTSDARAKNILGRSDSAADLSKLLGIEVTDFTFKDVVEKGNRQQKKVIAQQVEKFYPLAVRNTTDVVPDIYRKAPVNGGWIELATDLKVGDRVRLITENGHRDVHEVLEVKDGKFRTDFTDDVSQVFVYGREVKDFRVVDYEAISMLNVSATQELHRIIMQQDGEIQALSARLAALEQMLKEQTEKQPRQKEQ